jgi:hypothetical protein
MPPNLTTGPVAAVLDYFSGTPGNPLGANWSGPCTTSDGNPIIGGNVAQSLGNNGAASAYWNKKSYNFATQAVETWVEEHGQNVQLIGYFISLDNHIRFVADYVNHRLRLIVRKAGVDSNVHQTDGYTLPTEGGMWIWVEPNATAGLDIYCMYCEVYSSPTWIMAWPVYTDTTLARSTGYTGFRMADNINTPSTLGKFAANTVVFATSNTVVAPPASLTARSVAPSLRIDKTLISPPVVANAQSVAPLVSIPKTVVSVPAVVTEQSVAPSVSGTALVVSPPALFTSAAVAPLSILSPLVLPGAATWMASTVAPGLGRQIISSVGIFAAATTAPGTGNVVAPNAAAWTAAIATPVVVDAILPTSLVFTVSSVTPVVVQGVFTFPNAMVFTALGVSPSFSIIQVLTIPVAIWTATAVVPTLVKTIFPNAALVTFSTAAPALKAVLPLTAALETYTSSAPSFIAGSGQSFAVPPATFSATSGAISTSVYVVVPVAQFMSVGITPALINALAATVAVVSMSSATPLAIRSPLVAGLAPVVTMRASAPGILTGIGSTAAVFTATGAAPIPGNGQAIPGASFTAVIPSVQFEHAMLPLPIRTTFTSAASVSMVVQLPAGGWTAIASSPQLAAQVSPPAGRLTMPSMALTMDIEKKVFADVARWSAQLPLPQMSIKLTSPVPVWVGSPQNHQIGRGTIATPIRADFLSVEPDLAQESMQAIYTYQQGDIVESNAWPMWQH